MSEHDYDLVIVGGGLSGSALATAMAGHGARVLVIERETAFKDRVRGEGMTPWGVAEAKALRIYETLRDTCGHEVKYWDSHVGPMVIRRDLTETTPQRAPALDFYHPEMQEVLLRLAVSAGAEVWRGETVTGVVPGEVPRVVVEKDGKAREISAKLVVGADGRGSRVRTWVGFAVERDPPRLFVAGLLLEGSLIPMDAISMIQTFGRTAIYFPQRRERVRAYVVYHRDIYPERLQGPEDIPRFMEESKIAGTPSEWLAGARPAGPLATFEGADVWAPHPYRDRVVLIGDAAAATDPSWGQGLSLTMRDVRVLRDELLRNEDWDAAAHAYAAEHDRYYGILHTVEDWFTKLFMEQGPAADARRGMALPLLMQDPTRAPDALFSGPDSPVTEEDRIRFLGE